MSIKQSTIFGCAIGGIFVIALGIVLCLLGRLYVAGAIVIGVGAVIALSFGLSYKPTAADVAQEASDNDDMAVSQPAERPSTQQAYDPSIAPRSHKRRKTAIILCCFGFFGFAGFHRFYVGKTASGILYLLTFGLGFFGTIVDLCNLLGNNFTDASRFTLRA